MCISDDETYEIEHFCRYREARRGLKVRDGYLCAEGKDLLLDDDAAEAGRTKDVLHTGDWKGTKLVISCCARSGSKGQASVKRKTFKKQQLSPTIDS